MMLSAELQEAAGESAHDQLSRLFDAVARPLRKVSMGFGVLAGVERDSTVKSLSAAAAELSKALVITAENARLAALLKKHGRTIVNFRKILGQYVDAKTADELNVVLKSQMTRKDNAFSKFWEYRSHVLSIVNNYTTTVESVIDVGDFRVMLMTAPQGANEWDQEAVDRLRGMLTEVERRLDRFGMGSVAQGDVFAYPTSKLPPAALTGHSALASYSPRRNTMNVAAGHEGALHSVIHELGHRAYFKVLGGQGRAAWQEFWEANQGDPGVDGIIQRWEATVSNPPSDMYGSKYIRYLGHYLNHLVKQGAQGDRMWLNLLADNLDIDEKFDQITGSPKKGVKPGLDQLIAKKGKARAFLYPVTAYSGTSAEELFAEVFAELGTRGPERVAPVLRAAFRMALPQFRESRDVADGLAAALG
jgi:hypothetical protein